MSIIRNTLATVVGAAGIIASAYFALVVMFVGGISKTIDAFQAEPADNVDAAWGIAQVIFASTAFSIGVWVSVGIAWMIGAWRDE